MQETVSLNYHVFLPLCLPQGLGPSFSSSADLHTSVTAPHGDGSAPGLLDFLPMAPPLGLGMFASNITLHQTPHAGAYLPLLPSYLPAAPQTWPLWSSSPPAFSLPTPLGPHSKLYLPSAKSIRPCEPLPGQRVVVSLSLPQPRPWQPVLIACVLQEWAQDPRQHSTPKAQPFQQALRQQQQTPGASPPLVSALLGRLSPFFLYFPCGCSPFSSIPAPFFPAYIYFPNEACNILIRLQLCEHDLPYTFSHWHGWLCLGRMRYQTIS